jgi:hypothetical protein
MAAREIAHSGCIHHQTSVDEFLPCFIVGHSRLSLSSKVFSLSSSLICSWDASSLL